MLIYLIVGVIAILFLVQDMDEFFVGLKMSGDKVHEDMPHIPRNVISAGLALITILLWLAWPITVMYLIYKINNL
jgi:hypothetical protein